jgi:protein-tyrosine phosphatase
MTLLRKINILFVCMGNICRSPTAEAVFTSFVKQAGLSGQISVDSAGTHNYHIGAPPDLRSQQAALRRGYDMGDLRARQIQSIDFQKFDLILAMDNDNLQLLLQLSPTVYQSKIKLFCEFNHTIGKSEVPDPYLGDAAGFECVLDLVENASTGLLQYCQEKLTTDSQ